MNNIYKIYGLKLKNSNELRYIGYTGNSLEKRLNSHLNNSHRYKSKNACWINKHKNIEGIDIFLIEDNISKIEDAWEKEIYYISFFKGKGIDLTNTSNGGEGVRGDYLSEQLKGEKNPFYGKKHNNESKIKMSLKAKEKIGDKNNFFGKKHTEKTKNILSKKKLGKYDGIKNPFYGKKHSNESKIKMSSSGKKKDMSRFYKKIYQININTNEVIKLWDSIADAAETIFNDRKRGSNITAVLKGKKPHTGGFFWKYFD